jgi:hypothetical protein
LVFITVKCGVFFAVRTEFLDTSDDLRLQKKKFHLMLPLPPKANVEGGESMRGNFLKKFHPMLPPRLITKFKTTDKCS